MRIPALPLQLLLRRHPEWAGRPAGVVERDTPQGRIAWVNEAARRGRILPGMRYAQAVALDGDFTAETVAEEEVTAAVTELEQRLHPLAPTVEPAAEEPGVFWLSGRGLERLWPEPREWAEAVRGVVEGGGGGEARGSRRAARAARSSEEGIVAGVSRSYRAVSVVVGFTRFGTCAIARVRRGVVVLADSAAERRVAWQVPLEHLVLDSELRDRLVRLGIETIEDLLRLPAVDLGERFGPEAYELHRQAGAADLLPSQGEPPEEPLARCFDLESADDNTERLLFLVKQLLDPLLERLGGSRRELAGLTLSLELEDGGRRREAVRPAAPTLDSAQLLELVRLKLEGLELSSRVEEVELEATARQAKTEQLELFPVASRRDPAAANRALARLRAELGRETVVRARSVDKHLPEGTFLWEPLERLEPPAPEGTPSLRLVRRIQAYPRPLPPKPHHRRDGDWVVRGIGDGAVTRLVGPYVLSGGWWVGREVERHYHFAETREGELLWVFLDNAQRRWFLQGEVG